MEIDHSSMTGKVYLIEYGYNHADIGDFRNNKNYRICGSKTRQSLSNPYCQRPAGWGTYHPGVGRCKLHGGCAPMGPDHPNWRGGRYAYKYRGRLKQQFEGMELTDHNPMDLLPELAVQRLILTMALEMLNKPEPQIYRVGNKQVTLGLIKQIETVGGVGVGTNNVDMVPVDNRLAEFLWDNNQIQLISSLISDVVDTVTKIHKIRNMSSLTKTEVSWLISKIKQGLEKFVSQENRAAFISWLEEQIS